MSPPRELLCARQMSDDSTSAGAASCARSQGPYARERARAPYRDPHRSALSSGAWADASGLAGRLTPPQLVTYLKASIEGSDVLFEGRNSEGDGACVKCSGGQRADLVPTDPHEVLYVGGKQTQWLDYLSSPIIAVSISHRNPQEGLNVRHYRIMPPLSIGSQCYALTSA